MRMIVEDYGDIAWTDIQVNLLVQIDKRELFIQFLTTLNDWGRFFNVKMKIFFHQHNSEFGLLSFKKFGTSKNTPGNRIPNIQVRKTVWITSSVYI